MEIFVN
nr:unnamed protein product [Callosobruchus chinensis]